MARGIKMLDRRTWFGSLAALVGGLVFKVKAKSLTPWEDALRAGEVRASEFKVCSLGPARRNDVWDRFCMRLQRKYGITRTEVENLTMQQFFILAFDV